jgi:hypothetical protein
MRIRRLELKLNTAAVLDKRTIFSSSKKFQQRKFFSFPQLSTRGRTNIGGAGSMQSMSKDTDDGSVKRQIRRNSTGENIIRGDMIKEKYPCAYRFKWNPFNTRNLSKAYPKQKGSKYSSIPKRRKVDFKISFTYFFSFFFGGKSFASNVIIYSCPHTISSKVIATCGSESLSSKCVKLSLTAAVVRANIYNMMEVVLLR